jgi:hypothetical protein
MLSFVSLHSEEQDKQTQKETKITQTQNDDFILMAAVISTQDEQQSTATQAKEGNILMK